MSVDKSLNFAEMHEVNLLFVKLLFIMKIVPVMYLWACIECGDYRHCETLYVALH